MHRDTSSLKARLITFFKMRHTEWVPKGDLERIVVESKLVNYTAENVGRRLRELENDKQIEVKIVKGHAHYRIKQVQSREEMVRDARKAVKEFDKKS